MDYHTQGEGNGRAKLTWRDVNSIRERLAEGETGRALAKEFGVSPGTISGIKNGTKWQRPVIGIVEPREIQDLSDLLRDMEEDDEH